VESKSINHLTHSSLFLIIIEKVNGGKSEGKGYINRGANVIDICRWGSL